MKKTKTIKFPDNFNPFEHSDEYPWDYLDTFSNIEISNLLIKELSKPQGSQLNIEWIKVLINQCDLNKYDKKKIENPLIVACKNKHIDAIRELLKYDNINVNLQEYGDGYTALMHSIEINDIGSIKEILNKNEIDLDIRDEFGDTAITLAIINNNKDLIKSLLNHHSVNINTQEHSGISYLMYAIMYSDLEIVQEILKNPKTNLNLKNNDGETALMIAVGNGFTQVVQELLSHPAINITIINKKGQTAWDLAEPQIREQFPELNPNR